MAENVSRVFIMEIGIGQPWFSHVAKGRKTVEGRLNKGKFAELRVGSVLVASNSSSPKSSKRMVLVVTRLEKYPSFHAYLCQEGLARTLPETQSIDEGVAVYRKFYSAEEERVHGVLAIHVVAAT